MPYIIKASRERALNNPAMAGELNYAITMRLIEAYSRMGHPTALNKMKAELRELVMNYWINANSQNYQAINDILGALAGALMEFRVRTGRQSFGPHAIARQMIARAISPVVDEFYLTIAVPYERAKCEENGDVY
jgi:alpha-glucuronidase